jgi:hypothetical protein
MPKSTIISFSVDAQFLEQLDALSALCKTNRENILRHSLGLFSEALVNAQNGRHICYLTDTFVSGEDQIHASEYIDFERSSESFGEEAVTQTHLNEAPPSAKSIVKKSKRRLYGEQLLKHVPTLTIFETKWKTLTSVRRFIAANGLQPPYVINVISDDKSTTSYVYTERGLFTYQYASESFFLFSSLRLIEESIGEAALVLEIGEQWEGAKDENEIETVEKQTEVK